MTVSKTIISQFYEGIFRQAPSAETETYFESHANNDDVLLSMIEAAEIAVDPIIRLYQAAFNRVPDSPGMTSWVIPFSGQRLSLPDITFVFTQSKEFNYFYGDGLSNTQFVKTLYLNILQQEGDAKGTQGWIDALNQGALSRAQVLNGFVEAHQFKDKVEDNITFFLSQCAENTENYQGTLFDKVSQKTKTTLTINVDFVSSNQFYGYVIGEAGSIQSVSTLSSDDVLIGIGTNPTATLNLINTGGGGMLNASGQFNNINSLIVSAGGDGGSILDLSNANSINNVTVQNGTDDLTILNVNSLVPLTILSNSGSVSVDFSDRLVAHLTPAILNVNGVNGGDTPVIIDIGGSAPDLGFSKIILNSSGERSNIQTLTTSNDNDHSNLVINGSADITIENVNSNAITNLDLSGSSGHNHINIANANGNTTVIGGSGNDDVTFGISNLNEFDQIDLGRGINTISLEFNQPVLELSSLTQPKEDFAKDVFALTKPFQPILGASAISALNASANVHKIALTSSRALRPGETTAREIDLTTLKTMERVDLTGYDGIFADHAGVSGNGKSAVTLSGICTGETIGSSDVSGVSVDNNTENPTLGGVSALSLSAIIPDQIATLEFCATEDRNHGVIVKGGDGGHGGYGLVVGTHISALNIVSLNEGDARTAQISAHVIKGGDASSVIGAYAGVAIDNADNLNVTLSGNHALKIVGGYSHSDATPAFGFKSVVNVDASQLTGRLTLQGSNVVSGGDGISGGSRDDGIEGAGGADRLIGNEGRDVFFYRNGRAGEIASTNSGRQTELAAITDALNIEAIQDFTSGTDKIVVDTANPFFSEAQVHFTKGTQAIVTHIVLGDITATNIGDLLKVVNNATVGVASYATTASAYVVQTGTVSGGLSNASNTHFVILNDRKDAIDHNDMIINIGPRFYASGDRTPALTSEDWTWTPIGLAIEKGMGYTDLSAWTVT